MDSPQSRRIRLPHSGMTPLLVAVVPRTNSFVSAGQLNVIGTRGSPISGTSSGLSAARDLQVVSGRAGRRIPPVGFTGTGADPVRTPTPTRSTTFISRGEGVKLSVDTKPSTTEIGASNL